MGLEPEYLWSLTWRQYGALQRQWASYFEGQINMLAILRADIHNGWMPRKDNRAWTPQEFGATGKKPNRDPRKKWTPEEFQAHVMRQFGADGKGLTTPGKPGSALAALKGKGQPIPMPKRA